jgi:MFS family permease
MIASGMWIRLGISLFCPGRSISSWLGGSAMLGFGTALVYPTLLAAVSDVAHPEWRASAVGVYRLWRDGGYAVGALLSGIFADTIGIPYTMLIIAALTFISGALVAAVMYETLPSRMEAIPVDLPPASADSGLKPRNIP